MNEGLVNSLGICLGASSVSMVEIAPQGNTFQVVQRSVRSHLGDVRGCLTELLGGVADIASKRLCLTGRKFRNTLHLSSISEPEAVELAVRHLLPGDHPYRIVVSAGGETFIAYQLNNKGAIQTIYTGNKCASGTGDFFLQQLRRMDISLQEVEGMELPEKPFRVSGRCSVFCKSDCTHALNKGEAKASVVAGLCSMMADKLEELFARVSSEHVLLVGGCTENRGLVACLRRKVDDLLIPEGASSFEALGAALWAARNETLPLKDLETLFKTVPSHFPLHKPLHAFRHLVSYQDRPRGNAVAGDHVILGLDVGSTTTKGVLLRRSDKAVLASSYLRTNGDPIQAARQVYRALAEQIAVPVRIEGLGVTGSGRQIAGLHAMTPCVINEIIAHATAAAYFDPEVDTIFEIGGQDAKYTFLTNGVPNDYAMNEACSAGTGSFLEESAGESLGIDVRLIGDVAFQSEKPLNFNDQCSAFISSDIKTSLQQHIPVEDIVAGLVYSVCMNYINRVKGHRTIGSKIFIQGGVCYNKAVPAAMAALTGKAVIVPPDPGLMGAFGVALVVDKRMADGGIEAAAYDLPTLAARTAERGTSFICGGGGKCDRKCEIARIRIDGKSYPFGGICNRYDTIRHREDVDMTAADLVRLRQQILFEAGPGEEALPAVRLNRSFLVHTYYPFYRTFFQELGFRVILPETIQPEGISRRGAQFCYPAEIAHGYAADLLTKKADFTFLPHLRGMPSSNRETSCSCVFVQSEPYYLKTAFGALDAPTTLSPTVDFSDKPGDLHKTFAALAQSLGRGKRDGRRAFEKAHQAQAVSMLRLKERGRRFLETLEATPEETAVVLFGRPYNSFAPEANKGIPLKFAGRGVKIIPFDMLPYEDERIAEDSNMYWAMGDHILRCAAFVARHPQLYAVYITNFSCGPDSFLITFFRDIMGTKPSLTLELDSHTVDAGIATRVEAFLDIVVSYRQMRLPRPAAAAKRRPEQLSVVASERHGAIVRTSAGEPVPLTDPRVRLLLPSMSRFGTPLLAGAFAAAGIRAQALDPADAEVLKLGKGNSNCRECLPLQTTVGTILNYLQADRPKGEISVYFMPTAPGPCRFGQYNVFTRRVLARQEFTDVAVFSPTSKNCYGGLGLSYYLSAWRALVIGDLFDEMWATIHTAALDRPAALELLQAHHQVLCGIIHKDWDTIARQLEKTAAELGTIRLSKAYRLIPKLSLTGEIYVRRDPISLQWLVEKMAARGFIVRTSQNSEWFKYLDWLIHEGILGKKTLKSRAVRWMKERDDARIRDLLAPAGLFYRGDPRVKPVIEAGSRYISPQLKGEAILTVGSAFHDILAPACGIISIGPFGCMPTRVAEAVLSEKFTTVEKRIQLNGHAVSLHLLKGDHKFPFLSIETDGTPFPQITEARLEAFCIQAERLHREMLADSHPAG